jgi:dihydropteroate synthase
LAFFLQIPSMTGHVPAAGGPSLRDVPGAVPIEPLRNPGGFDLTLRRALFPREEFPLRLRILSPVFPELPEEIRDAAIRAGAVPGRWGDRPALWGDPRSMESLASDPGAPGAFRTALALVLLRRAPRRFVLALPRGRSLRLGDPPAIFGVINATPDSFSDGGVHLDPGCAIEAVLRMAAAGADAIDVGGESSRPGASPVPADEERRRVEPVIRRIRKALDLPISIDTTKAEVARMALAEGADIVNDVSALRDDPEMVAVVRESGAPAIVLHRKGTSRDMQVEPRYDDPTREVYEFLEDRIRTLEAQGIDPGKVLVDPGIGFGKRLMDNLTLIGDIDELRSLGRPVFVGASRKSFLGSILGGAPVGARDEGTIAAHAAAVLGGAAAIRVHEVTGHRDLLRVLGGLERVQVGGD